MPPSDAHSWRQLAFDLQRVTEAGARAAAAWKGRGRPAAADEAAARAMRDALASLDAAGTVVSGEGEKDGVPHLAYGEHFGAERATHQLDLAVDPIDGTTRLSAGRGGAVSVLAAAPAGTLFDPGPAFYMDKFVAGPEAWGQVTPEAGTHERLASLAAAQGRRVQDLSVFVLDKPRHEGLIENLRAAGARTAVHPAGDIEGALRAAMPRTGIDALVGIGGTPEGLIAACAVRALGGTFFGRLAPQAPEEAARLRAAGCSSQRWRDGSELAQSERLVFCATGVTAGPLLDGVCRSEDAGGAAFEGTTTETLLIVGQPGRPGAYHFVGSTHASTSRAAGSVEGGE